MFVTGCHRSGTSLVASFISKVLTADNAAISDDQLPAALDNPGGFHESTSLVAANDALLEAIGAKWDQPPLLPVNWCSQEAWPQVLALREQFSDRALTRCWVDKDPRLAITASAYQHIFLRRPALIIVLREPCAVAQSLYARDRMPLSSGLCLWWIYNFHLAHIIRSADIVLTYESLSTGILQQTTAERLRAVIKSETGKDITNQLLQDALVDRNHPEWKRSSSDHIKSLRFNEVVTDSDLSNYCQESYRAITNTGETQIAEVFAEIFGSIPAQIITSLALKGWQGWSPGHQPPSEKILEESLAALKSSTCWKATTPLRFLRTAFSTITRKPHQ